MAETAIYAGPLGRPATPLGLAVAALMALRPHQWAKNLLVLAPVAAAHAWADWPRAAAMAGAFCASAAAVYLVNDLCDLAADRAHPHKRHRPLASGALPVWLGWALVPVLAALALAAVLPLGGAALAWLGAYAAISTAYSLWLKRVRWLDVGVLAGFYLLRLGAGSAALGVALSPWLALLAAGLFASLACAKRAGELSARGPEGRRGWTAADTTALNLAGGLAALVAVAALAAYPLGEQALALYRQPGWLALAALPLAAWLWRVWTAVRAGLLHHDPVMHAVRDPAAWATALAMAGAWVLAGPR